MSGTHQSMKRALSLESGLPITVFKPTIGRLQMRMHWGRMAGRLAYARGDAVNAFRMKRHMPMHLGWDEGYKEAEHNKADAEAANAAFRDGGRA